jgi:protein TonB
VAAAPEEPPERDAFEPEPAEPAATAPSRAPLPDAAPSPAPQQAPSLERFDLGGYGAALQAAILTHRRYPPAARRLALEGVVEVEIQLRRDGGLSAPPRVVTSSGHAMLDRQALQMIERATPFKPLPEQHAGAVAEFRVPVRFQLRY